MGDVNLDMSRSKIFAAATYVCAGIGAVTGVHMTAATSTLGLIGAGAVGAVAGGIGIPLALTGVAVLGYVGFVGIKSTIKALKKEGAAVPLGMALVGLSAAKALFVTPFTTLRDLGKKLINTKTSPQKPDSAAATQGTNAPEAANRFFSRAKLKPLFEKALSPLRKKPATPAPKPKNIPKPPNV